MPAGTSTSHAIPAGSALEPKLRAIACVGGLSIERNIPTTEISDYIKDRSNLVWLDVQDPGEEELAMLTEEFGFHPLSIEDVSHAGQRPKVDDYKGYLFVVAYTVPQQALAHDLDPVEVDLFIGRNYLVTVHRGRVAAMDEAFLRWTRGGELMRDGIGYLVYSVLDTMVDAFFPVLDQIEDEVEEAELTLLTQHDGAKMASLLKIKRTLVTLRRLVGPMRDVFNSLLRREQALFEAQTRIYLQDVYDHLLRIIDAIESEREMLSSAIEAYLTVLSNRLNSTMKTLTLITVIVAFVGAVFGAWGMNFDNIPFAESPLGFWLVLTGTVAIVGTGVWLAWRRNWL
jgi:magnesium transporter